MTEEEKAAAKFISTADIDAIFTKPDDADGALKTSVSHDGR